MKKLIEKLFGSFNWLLVSLFLVIIPVIWAKKSMLDLSLIPRQMALSILLIILGLSFTWAVIRKKFTFYFNKTDKIVFGALAIYMLIHIVSSFGVINYQEAIYRTVKEFGFMLWVFFIYQLLRYQPKGREVLIKSVIVSGSIFIGIGIYQLVTSDFSEFLKATGSQVYFLTQIMNNVFSTCSNKNLFAEILFLILVFTLYGSIVYRNLWRIISLFATIFDLALIIMLLTRSVYTSIGLSIIFAGIFLVIYFFRIVPKQGKEVPEWIKITFIGTPIISIITLTVVLKTTNFQFVEAFKEKIDVTFNSKKFSNINEDNPSSTRSRIIIWSKTIQMIKDHPIIGAGPGQWQILIPSYGVNELENDTRQGTLLWQRPHSDLLWIGAEEGILGLICYLVFYFGAIVVAIRSFINQNDKRIRIFNILAAIVMVGWLVDLSSNYAHERIEHNLFYLLIAVIIYADIPFDEKVNNQTTFTKRIKWLLLFIIPFVFYNFYVTQQFYQGEKVARAIKIANMRKDYNRIIREAKKMDGTLYTLDNFTTPIPYYQGIAYAAFKNYKEAHKALEKAYKLNPYHLQTINNYATSFDLTGNSEMAIKYYKEALAISPRYKDPLVNLAIVYFNKNDFDTALNYIAQLPYDLAGNPEKYKQSYLTICRRIAYVDQLKFNPLLYKDWINNEEKITTTFLKFKNEGGSFHDILIKELNYPV